ncbi:anthranilate synthase component I family protein [Flavobacterium silvaticum]|uniref:Anthranilate synthase component I family protein n=1 Tax=Flavobacterium silvaticum TaxID=1852020 RepID=A0A972FMG9_9FLAO|nr:anthranilate synthase component I family protein [Flavobacterium silvaticum]NMH28764.1 anthranilate synthase component I family protein [Flavobacterium silvaticum]
MRTVLHRKIPNPNHFRQQLLEWAQQFREVQFLDSNGYEQTYSDYDCVLAADAFLSLKTDSVNAFNDLEELQKTTKDWLFGYLSYDLKNDVEALNSNNLDCLGFPDLYFFQPKKLFVIKGSDVELLYLPMCDDEMEADFESIQRIVPKVASSKKPLLVRQRISHDDYLKKFSKLANHIHRGDIYEANFCMEFYAHPAQIDPLPTFRNLNAISEPPFSAYFKHANQYILSASPERYLKKKGHKIISQPIKGTAGRSENPDEDRNIRHELSANEKERSENIMIVDLVRNDLSRTATKGSVHVEELCQPYTFRQVHHLISTVVSEVEHNLSPVEVLRTTFPMGSMTGAPKISAMQIIEELEETKRGVYSGALGYFMPNGDFDFNVVIRSILYDSDREYVSFSVGSAITAASDAHLEYEECLVKAVAMRKVLETNETDAG